MKEYYVYKWIVDDEIIYIGKTTNPRLRFIQERHEEKFKPYLDAQIWTTKFTNSTEMSGMEKLLINKYKPVLNYVDKHSVSMDLPVDDSKLVWDEYTAIEREEKEKCELLRKEKELKDLEEKLDDAIRAEKYLTGIETVYYYILSMLLENIKAQTFIIDPRINTMLKNKHKDHNKDDDIENEFSVATIKAVFEEYHLSEEYEEALTADEFTNLIIKPDWWDNREDIIRIDISQKGCADFIYDRDDSIHCLFSKYIEIIALAQEDNDKKILELKDKIQTFKEQLAA